jgi:hypothetical protein
MGGGSSITTRRNLQKSIKVVLPRTTILKVDRIYVRKGASEYNSLSFVLKKAPFYFKGKVRFWAKLPDVNKIEFEFELYES